MSDTSEELVTLRAAVRGLLARVDAIEDRLGLDTEREDRELLKQLQSAYKAAGYSTKSAKNLAWADRKRGLTLAEAVARMKPPPGGEKIQ